MMSGTLIILCFQGAGLLTAGTGNTAGRVYRFVLQIVGMAAYALIYGANLKNQERGRLAPVQNSEIHVFLCTVLKGLINCRLFSCT